MFFSDKVGIEFQSFSFIHILLFIFVIVGAILIFVFREKIRKYEHERRIMKIIAIIALLWEFGLYAWYIFNGTWEWDQNLPIGLCAFTLYIGIFALYFKKFSLFEIGYFWSWGAIASVLFPDILYSYDRYRFYQFMLGHINFFLMYLYMIFIYKWYPTIRSYKKSAITLILIVAVLLVTGIVTDTNLMFLRESEGTPFEIFEGNGPTVYLVLVMISAAALMLLWYTPIIYINRKQKIKAKIKNK